MTILVYGQWLLAWCMDNGDNLGLWSMVTTWYMDNGDNLGVCTMVTTLVYRQW